MLRLATRSLREAGMKEQTYIVIYRSYRTKPDNAGYSKRLQEGSTTLCPKRGPSAAVVILKSIPVLPRCWMPLAKRALPCPSQTRAWA